jgi:hypothetical protein
MYIYIYREREREREGERERERERERESTCKACDVRVCCKIADKAHREGDRVLKLNRFRDRVDVVAFRASSVSI